MFVPWVLCERMDSPGQSVSRRYLMFTLEANQSLYWSAIHTGHSMCRNRAPALLFRETAQAFSELQGSGLSVGGNFIVGQGTARPHDSFDVSRSTHGRSLPPLRTATIVFGTYYSEIVGDTFFQ